MTAMDARTARVLEQIGSAWRDLQSSWQDLPDEALTTPGVTGDWTVKDILAHVTTWEDGTMIDIADLMTGRPASWYGEPEGGIDGFNAAAAEDKASLTLDQVRHDLEETHARLLAFVPTIPPDLLDGASKVGNRLRDDTWDHYPEHTEAILAWRARHLA